jgi:hypothetical protein
MVELLTDVSPGVLGFRISGRLTRADYADVLLPPLREAVERGRVRLLAVLEPDFHGLDTGALAEDIKAAATLGFGHRSAWERSAIVTDTDWIRKATELFGWLAPGELRVFSRNELEAAKAWLAGSPS